MFLGRASALWNAQVSATNLGSYHPCQFSIYCLVMYPAPASIALVFASVRDNAPEPHPS